MRIGFIGTGTMGTPIAGCLVAAGHQLTVYDIRHEATEALHEQGAAIVDTPRAVAQATVNRQGRGDVLQGEAARRVLDLLREDSERAYAGYAAMLNEDEAGAPLDPAWPGLARELARMNLSLNFYTQWYWKIDLYNLMHFLGLRADPHAQYEIRAFAEAMLGTMQRWVPLAHAAFLEYRMNAASISATGLKVIQRMLAGETVEQKDSGLSPREWRELMAVLGR